MMMFSKSNIFDKVVCPMEGCEAVFDVDETFTKTCNFTECQECHRGFCLTCQTPWHPSTPYNIIFNFLI